MWDDEAPAWWKRNASRPLEAGDRVLVVGPGEQGTILRCWLDDGAGMAEVLLDDGCTTLFQAGSLERVDDAHD